MAQDFMDVLKKQTATMPRNRVYPPAPETLPTGPIMVLVVEPGFINGSVVEPGEKIRLANGAKEFARKRLPNGATRKLNIDGKEYTTSYEESWMRFLEDLSKPAGNETGAPNAGGDKKL